MAKDAGVDYKKKYEDLRSRYLASLDMAYRGGYEQGYNDAQNEAMAQQAQMMQQQQMQQAQMMGQMGGQMDQQAPEEQQDQQMGQGDEMGQAIEQLESLVNKSEPDMDSLKKSLAQIKETLMLKNIANTTKKLGSAMGKKLPRPLSQSYRVNLPHESKQAVVAQSNLIDGIMRKWEQEEAKSSNDILNVLGNANIKKD